MEIILDYFCTYFKYIRNKCKICFSCITKILVEPRPCYEIIVIEAKIRIIINTYGTYVNLFLAKH